MWDEIDEEWNSGSEINDVLPTRVTVYFTVIYEVLTDAKRNQKGIRQSAYLRHAMPDPRKYIVPNTFLKYYAIYRFGPYLSMVKNCFKN